MELARDDVMILSFKLFVSEEITGRLSASLEVGRVEILDRLDPLWKQMGLFDTFYKESMTCAKFFPRVFWGLNQLILNPDHYDRAFSLMLRDVEQPTTKLYLLGTAVTTLMKMANISHAYPNAELRRIFGEGE